MTISDHINRVRNRLRHGEFTSEAAVSQGILLPALNELGWPVFETTIVIPEFSVEGRRVDYALCHPTGHPYVFVEVKKVGLSDGADRQLFEYAFHQGVPMAILTDGQEWSFYLPGEQGRYDERRVYKIDLLERSTEEAARRLERYLRYDRVCSGEALTAARSDYQDVARIRAMETVLPRAWITLLQDSDSLLIELLAETVEDLCGYRPDPDLCSRFLARKAEAEAGVTAPLPFARSRAEAVPPTTPEQKLPGPKALPSSDFQFVFEGRTHHAKSAKQLMEKVFRVLAEADPGFLDRFAARKHGRKRRYIARDKMELYPGRPDLAEEYSVEIAPGWWLGTNYSHKNIQQILDLALEVTRPSIRAAIEVSVE